MSILKVEQIYSEVVFIPYWLNVQRVLCSLGIILDIKDIVIYYLQGLVLKEEQISSDVVFIP